MSNTPEIQIRTEFETVMSGETVRRRVPSDLSSAAFKACQRIEESLIAARLFKLENIKVKWGSQDNRDEPDNPQVNAEFIINLDSPLTPTKKTLRIYLHWKTRFKSGTRYQHHVHGCIENSLCSYHQEQDVTAKNPNKIEVIVTKSIHEMYVQMIKTYFSQIKDLLTVELSMIDSSVKS